MAGIRLGNYWSVVGTMNFGFDLNFLFKHYCFSSWDLDNFWFALKYFPTSALGCIDTLHYCWWPWFINYCWSIKNSWFLWFWHNRVRCALLWPFGRWTSYPGLSLLDFLSLRYFFRFHEVCQYLGCSYSCFSKRDQLLCNLSHVEGGMSVLNYMLSLKKTILGSDLHFYIMYPWC